jgi:hypothetical protein
LIPDTQLLEADLAGTESVWRRFVSRFLTAAVLALVAIGTLNYLVNPEGLYGTHLVPQILWSARPQKAALLEAARPVPEALILGSSRVMNIPPKEVEHITGLVTFNAGVDSAKTEDFYILLRYAVENLHLKPRLLIVGCDVEALHNHEPPHYYLQKPSALAAFLWQGQARSWRWKRFTNLLSYPEAQVSLLALYKYLRGETEALTETDPDGYSHFNDWLQKKANGQFNLNAEIYSTVERFAPRYDNFTGLSAERLDYFEATLRYARDHNIDVVVFMTPTHSAVEAGLAPHGYGARKHDVVSALQRLCTAWNVPFYDLSAAASFGGDPDRFYDGVHYDSSFTSLILSRILPVRTHAVQ